MISLVTISYSFLGFGLSKKLSDSKLMESRLDFKIKFEGGNVSKMRKRACRKIFKTLTEKYSLEKNLAKSISMNLEYRMNITFDHETQNQLYVNSFKNFLKYLANIENKLEELNKVKRMPLDQFRSYIVSINR